MHGAAEKGHDEVVKTLTNHNADVNAVTVVSWCRLINLLYYCLFYRKSSLPCILLLSMAMPW